ncbi:urease accessory protein UreE [Tahibacter caeni]|uniref:urease accessory protein UreE n=1 Tax=Tahibacter caeni TaxID=1453545 RepID=UPI0021476DFD|nr:urease accessory protein UreE [Tahibacter caeni]
MQSVLRHIPAAEADATAEATPLPLNYELRRRSRQRLRLADGSELALALPGGTVLHPGDLLEADDGRRYRVQAQAEPLLRAGSDDGHLLLRAAYHLGNRHVAVAVEPQALLLEADPVLREMLQRLGLEVAAVHAPFEPESGAYGGGHRHGHDATFTADQALAHSLYYEYAAASGMAETPFLKPPPHG